MTNSERLSTVNEEIRGWEIEAYTRTTKEITESDRRSFDSILWYNKPFVDFLAAFLAAGKRFEQARYRFQPRFDLFG